VTGEVLIGVSGGIAAFKTAAVVSRLVQDGLGVSVVMTAAARHFIGAATFTGLTGRRVYDDVFDMDEHPLGPHIELAQRADVFCIAPATANVLAKLAWGMADDLLSTIALAAQCPIAVAPAMNQQMWAHAAVQRNVQQLRDDGVHIIEVQSGWLSCRQQGAGRMAEPETIVQAIHSLRGVTS